MTLMALEPHVQDPVGCPGENWSTDQADRRHRVRIVHRSGADNRGGLGLALALAGVRRAASHVEVPRGQAAVGQLLAKLTQVLPEQVPGRVALSVDRDVHHTGFDVQFDVDYTELLRVEADADLVVAVRLVASWPDGIRQLVRHRQRSIGLT
jgi:hypothetical protein